MCAGRDNGCGADHDGQFCFRYRAGGHAIHPQLKSTGKAIVGIDISAYQHPSGAAIDFPAVRAAKIRFVAVKVDEGGGYVNPYSRDMLSARVAGMYVTGYHFARPRLPLSTAVSDARAFVEPIATAARGTLPPMLDIEMTDGLSASTVVSWVRTWVTTVRNWSGRTPIIYTGGWFWGRYLNNPGGFSGAPLWIADYEPSLNSPHLTGDWTHSTWQYGDNGRVRESRCGGHGLFPRQPRSIGCVRQ